MNNSYTLDDMISILKAEITSIKRDLEVNKNKLDLPTYYIGYKCSRYMYVYWYENGIRKQNYVGVDKGQQGRIREYVKEVNRVHGESKRIKVLTDTLADMEAQKRLLEMRLFDVVQMYVGFQSR